jgi:RNA polymerase sigma factor (sigma-70 family)
VTRAEAERLAGDNLWRCEAVARRMTRHRPGEFDEAYSAALAGLAEAIRNSPDTEGLRDPASRFAYHADHVIRWRVSDAFKSRRFGGASVEAEISGAAVARVVEDAPGVGWEQEWEDLILTLSRRLPRGHGRVFVASYLHADGATQRGAAARLGISQARVTRILGESVRMLRESYARRAAG